MADYPLFPKSRIAGFADDDQYEVTHDTILDIAEEARQAFFKVVCDRIKDLYPDSQMWGDETPGEMYQRDQIAFDWVMEHARNSEAVQQYEAEECIISTLEATEPATLLDSDEWPEGLESVQVEKEPFVGSYWPTVTLRGTRRALTTFILERWGDDDGGTYDNAYLEDITPVSQIATENLKEQS